MSKKLNMKNCNLVFLILSILFFGVFDTINMYKIPSIYTSICQTFSLDGSQVAWVMAAYSTTAAIMAIPTGFFNDKFGAKKIIIIGVAVSALGTSLGAVSFWFFEGNVYLLCTSRIMEGLCYIFASVCMPVFIKQILQTENIGLTLGIWAVRTKIASFIGETFTPSIVDATSFSGAWLIYCGCMMFFAFLMFIASKSFDYRQVASDIKIKTKVTNPASNWSIAAWFISFMTIAIVQSSVMDYVPTILQTKYEVDPGLSGLLTSVPMLVSIASCLIFGYLVDRVKSYKPLYTFGLLCLAPGAFLMMSCGLPLFAVGAVLMGIGLGAPAISACAVFEIFNKKYYGIAIGFAMSLFSVGQIIGARCTQIILGDDFNQILLCSIIILIVGLFGALMSFIVKIRNT